MRRVVAVVLALGLAGVVASSAVATSRPASHAPKVSSTLEVTGMVNSLGMSKITVARTTCSMRSSKIAELANSFAVGENVTVACVDGTLRTITLAPVTSGPTHPDSIVATLHLGSSTASGSTSEVPGCAISGTTTLTNKMTWTTGSVALGTGASSGAPTVTGTVCVTGTITATAGGISVDDQTCPMGSGSGPNTGAVATFLTENIEVGEQATMGCTVYSDGQSDGTIAFSTSSSNSGN